MRGNELGVFLECFVDLYENADYDKFVLDCLYLIKDLICEVRL